MSAPNNSYGQFIDHLYKAGNVHVTEFEFENSVPLDGRLQGKKVVDQCIFLGGIASVGFVVDESLIFQNCTFGKGAESSAISLEKVTGRTIWFLNCYFNGKVEFKDPQNVELLFNGCEFDGNVYFRGRVNKKEITAIQFGEHEKTRSLLRKSIDFGSCVLSHIRIRDTTILDTIGFHGKTIPNVFIGHGLYGHLRIDNGRELRFFNIKGDSDRVNELQFKTLTAPYLTLAEKGNFSIRNAQIGQFNLQSFVQGEAVLSMNNVRIDKTFRITESDLGRIVFNEVNLEDAQITFDHSYVGSCEFSNIKWPKGHLVTPATIVDKTDQEGTRRNASILRESYRQLKNAMKSSSNNIDALWFYRNEMQEYWKEVKGTDKLSPWEKFIIWVNKYSSDFGLSLKRPLIGLLLFHLIFFSVLVLLNYDNLKFSLDVEPDAMERGLTNFVTMISPVHGYIDNGISPIGKVVDFLMRISSGFFIYHILRATRKYGKL